MTLTVCAGSMVADVHRTILYGGVFLYPVRASADCSDTQRCVILSMLLVLLVITGR